MATKAQLCRIAIALAATGQVGVTVTLPFMVKILSSREQWVQIWLEFLVCGLITLVSQFVRGLYLAALIANLAGAAGAVILWVRFPLSPAIQVMFAILVASYLLAIVALVIQGRPRKT